MSKINHIEQEDYSITAVPLYHWRGTQPWLFELASSHQGWLTCLHLTREGDSTLMPLAWQHVDATGDDDRTLAHDNPLTSTAPKQPDNNRAQQEFPYPASSFQTTALHSEAVKMTLNAMEQDGWQLNGRFDIYFTGTDTDAHFQQNFQQILWQTPFQKDEL